MLDTRVRSFAAAIAISAIAAVAAGCGSSRTTTVTATPSATVTAAPSTTVTATPSTAAAGGSTTGGGSGGGGASKPLAGISPPPGSTKLNSRSGAAVVYARYSTNMSPAQVRLSSYSRQLTSMGWSIVNSGGSGGGWGPVWRIQLRPHREEERGRVRRRPGRRRSAARSPTSRSARRAGKAIAAPATVQRPGAPSHPLRRQPERLEQQQRHQLGRQLSRRHRWSGICAFGRWARGPTS